VNAKDLATEIEEFLEAGGEPKSLWEMAAQLKRLLEPFGAGARHLRDRLDRIARLEEED
jgi:hypothetical protein